MPHSDDEIGTYIVKVTAQELLQEGISEMQGNLKRLEFFVDIVIKNTNWPAFTKSPSPTVAYLYSSTIFELPKISNKAIWDYSLSV